MRSEELTITYLLHVSLGEDSLSKFHMEQEKDLELQCLRQFIEYGILPADEKKLRKLVAQALNFVIIDNVLYFVDTKGGGRKLAVVPTSTEHHPGGLPRGKDGWAFFWSLYVHVTELSVVVAYHVQGCAGVQSQL